MSLNLTCTNSVLFRSHTFIFRNFLMNIFVNKGMRYDFSNSETKKKRKKIHSQNRQWETKISFTAPLFVFLFFYCCCSRISSLNENENVWEKKIINELLRKFMSGVYANSQELKAMIILNEYGNLLIKQIKKREN